MGFLSFLFGNKTKQIHEFLQKDAVILDVRTQAEYAGGAIHGSKNIPVQELAQHISEIKQWNKPVITCCVSGIRSGNAAKMLRNNGVEAVNGGGWTSLSKQI